MQSSMRVVLSPPAEATDTNPYLNLLEQSLVRQGAQVRRYFPRAFLSDELDVWHLHWPENVLLEPDRGRAVRLIIRLLSRLVMAKTRGIKIVWTCHNLEPHEAHDRALASAFWCAFSTLVDGVFSLSEAGLRLLAQSNPRLARKVVAVTPHGHYRDAYPTMTTPDEARQSLGIQANEKVVLFFGQVRRYKNVRRLIECFAAVSDPQARLIVTGACPDPDLRAEVEHEAAADPRVQLFLSAVEDARVSAFMLAADLVVLPFSQVLNSGSVMLGLSFSRPVLAPMTGALPELARQVGSEWLMLFDDELEAEHLRVALDWCVHPKQPSPCDLTPYEWDTIAGQTIEGYRRVCGM